MRDRKRALFFSAVLALLLLCLGGATTTLAASGQGRGIPNPGPPPKGMDLKVFIHYAKGGGKPAPGPSVNDRSYSYSGIHWADPDWSDNRGIPYYVNLESGTGSLLTGDALAAIDASFKAWTDAQDASVLRGAKLLYRNAGPEAVGVVADNKFVVSWGSLDPGAIAVTYVWYYRATKAIAEFDIVLNTQYNWSYSPPAIGPYDPVAKVYGDPTNSGTAATYDVRNIMTHEVGHTLMLNDLYGASDVFLTMYGYAGYGELNKDTLGYGDFLGLNKIY